jgi:hypothetical protein
MQELARLRVQRNLTTDGTEKHTVRGLGEEQKKTGEASILTSESIGSRILNRLRRGVSSVTHLGIKHFCVLLHAQNAARNASRKRIITEGTINHLTSYGFAESATWFSTTVKEPQ